MDISYETQSPLDTCAVNNSIITIIRKAAEQCIPQITDKYFQLNAAWWDSNCSKAVAERKRAKGKLVRAPTLANLINFKRCEAKAKNTQIKKKRESWREFVGSMSSSTTIKATWNKIRSIGRGVKVNNVRPIADIPIEDDESKAQQFEDHYTSETQQNWRYLPDVQIEVDRLKSLTTYKTE